MALVLADRVKESCTSPGTGTVTLLGAQTEYQSFSAGVGANNTTYYVIADQSGANWEVGLGTVGSGGTTLARTTVLSSSNSGSLVNFSSGTQDVWVDYPASKAVHSSNNPGTSGQVLTSGGTGVAPTWTNAATGTVTSVGATASTGISVSGSPITGSGSFTITNTAPDQTVTLTGSGSTTVTGTYPNFTISSTSGGSPGGSTNQLQYNNSGSFGGLSSGTSGQTLVSGGSGSNPAFSANLVVASNNVDTSANTGGFIPPSGTTAQRPASPVNGTTRFNTTTNAYEVWSGLVWVALTSQSYSVSYLVVAGGGGGGSSAAGGGGAGGLLTGTSSLNIGTTYSITVGAGGAGGVGTGSNTAAHGANGNNSVFNSFTAIAGGGGAGDVNGGGAGNGGSGGGGSYILTYGTGTSGQGNAGGTGGGTYVGGGGGGAGATGGNYSGTTGGVGGVGIASSITGSSVYYAGGGGGGGYVGNSGGAGGNGGGGAGGTYTTGVSGTANTGGGGGGSGNNSTNGGAGGSGVVIISVPTANYSGTTSGSPTVTTSGSNTIMKFTSSGSYTA